MKFSKEVKATFLHTAEAMIVFGLAVCVGRFFPEHQMAAGVVALATLSGFAKYARVSDSIPVSDYVNEEESGVK